QTSALLTTSVPPRTRVVHGQSDGFTNLEVHDASLWPASPFTPFAVRIGAGSGLEEDATLVDRTLASGLSGSLSVAATFGQTAITLSSSTGFPESSVPNKAGYRVVLDRGNAG